MVNFDTKIELNNKILYVDNQSVSISFCDEIFNKFIDLAKSFILNDNGELPAVNYKEYSGLKKELSKFDISADKEFGNGWEFEVNEHSRKLIIKSFKAYKPIAHTKWVLKGDDFSITYMDCGDMNDLIDGPDGKETISTRFIIEAKINALKNINYILKSYKTKSE